MVYENGEYLGRPVNIEPYSYADLNQLATDYGPAILITFIQKGDRSDDGLDYPNWAGTPNYERSRFFGQTSRSGDQYNDRIFNWPDDNIQFGPVHSIYRLLSWDMHEDYFANPEYALSDDDLDKKLESARKAGM